MAGRKTTAGESFETRMAQLEALIERMDSRHGIHTVETACERHHLGLRDYEIISID